MQENKINIKSKKGKYPIVSIVLYLLITWSVAMAVDIYKVPGTEVVLKKIPDPIFWYSLFKPKGLTEMLQWALLTGTIIFSGIVAGKLLNRGSRYAYKFFFLFGIGVSLMLSEDAGSAAYIVSNYTYHLFGATEKVGMITQLVFYAILGMVMMYAIIKYGKYIWKWTKTRVYIIIGFLCYGITSTASALRDINDWYTKLGDIIHQSLLGGRMEDPFGGVLGFYIVDYWIEESIEIIGAASFLTAMILAVKYIEQIDSEIYPKF